MLKNQLENIDKQIFQVSKPYREQLRWVGSRASGSHLLQISKYPGLLSIINQDSNLDVVNIIYTNKSDITTKEPFVKDCESTFWIGDRIKHLPYPKNYFDTVIIDQTYPSLVNNKEFEIVKKLLKPNGKIIVTHELIANEYQFSLWTQLLSDFKELDKRVGNNYISWVARNGKDLESSEQQKEMLINEIQQKVDERKLQYPKDEKVNPSYAEESLHFETDDSIVWASKHLSTFIIGNKVAVVLGSDGYYHNYSLKFSHQLTNALLKKGFSVVYVSLENTQILKPISHGKKNLIQLNLESFEKNLHLFAHPLIFLTSPKQYFAKILGRFQWNKWSIFYLPEVVLENEEETHQYLISALNPTLFNGIVGSQIPVSAVERESLFAQSNHSQLKQNMVLGYIGSLDANIIDYTMIKKVLDNNEFLTIELIGYHLPMKLPFRDSRLIIREYTHIDEAAKRVAKWSGGIVPFDKKSENVSLQLMRSLEIPLLYVTTMEGYRIHSDAFISPEHPKLISDLLEKLLPSTEG